MDGRISIAVRDPITGVETRKEVKAEVHALLAIHRRLEARGEWNITHIPSGYALCTCHSRKDAREVVERLQAVDIDWNFTSVTGKKARVAGKVSGTILRAAFDEDLCWRADIA